MRAKFEREANILLDQYCLDNRTNGRKVRKQWMQGVKAIDLIEKALSYRYGDMTWEDGRLLEPGDLQIMCTAFLNHVAQLDPLWDQRIKLTREETGRNDLQIVTAWIGHVLDTGSHMLHPPHPYFETSFQAAGSQRACSACDKVFSTHFAGETCCSDECYDASQGRGFRKRQQTAEEKELRAEVDAEAAQQEPSQESAT